jgi:hypothetical protein
MSFTFATHGFSTVAFAMTAHETTFAMAGGWSLYFLVSVLGYIAAPTVLSVLATYPSLAAIKGHAVAGQTKSAAFSSWPLSHRLLLQPSPRSPCALGSIHCGQCPA